MPAARSRRSAWSGALRAIRPASLLALGLWLLATGATALEKSPLVIVTPSARHSFTVEVARTPAERSRGLMYRESLAVDGGMLFDFGQPQPVTMWMRNTLIPLDMLFIDEDGRIRRIEANAEPLSLDTIASGAPVSAVLELNGGTAAILNIRAGDRVLHPLFGNTGPDPTASLPPRTPE
jgi:uncharacterized membrane protein (UPF0127 family)